MSILQYSSSKQGNVILIRVGGSLDAETAPKFSKKIDGEISKGAVNILCNLEKLDYIASAGLGVIISANETLRKKGGEVRLSSMNEKIKKIFKLLGFLNLFKIFDNEDEGLKSF